MTICAMDEYLGAYAIDALEPEEAVAVRAHLDGCPECRAELDSLASTVSHLWLLTAADVDVLAALEQPEPAASAATTQRRRRRGPVFAMGAAVLAAAGALLALLGGLSALDLNPLGNSHRAADRPTVVRAADPATQISAAVTVTGHSWGSELHLSVMGHYPGRCYLVAHSRDGGVDTAATWISGTRDHVNVDGGTAISANRLTELDVVSATTGRQLVRLVMPNS